MQKRANSPNYSGLRQSRPRPSSILWLCWCCSIMVGVAIICVQSLTGIQINDSERFSGTVYVKHKITEITLPEEAILQTVLVGVGDHVDPGTTLAILDTKKMIERRNKLEQDLRVAAYTLSCLQSFAEPQLHEDMEQSEIANLKKARSTCSQLESRRQAELKELAAEVAVVEEDERLIEDYALLRIASLESANADQLKQIIALKLARNKLSRTRSKLDVLRQEIERKAQARKAHILGREVSKLERLESRIKTLSTLISAPKLQTHGGGVVGGIRDLYSPDAHDPSSPFIEIFDHTVSEIMAEFHVSDARSDLLALGQTVRIRSFGLSDPAPELFGSISKKTRSNKEWFTIEVVMDQTSKEVLRRLKSGSITGNIAIESEAEVDLENRAFWAIVIDHVWRAF